jgi:SulP family sulfate permease
MNEWESVHFFASNRLRHAVAGMVATMIATVALDLTQAIIIGIALSAVIYLRQSAASVAVNREPVDLDRLRAQGHDVQDACPLVHVYYLTGPLFFGSVHAMLEAFETAGDYRALVISMRGVPLIDAMGARALGQIIEEQHGRGATVSLSGVQPAVRTMLARTGIVRQIGEGNIFWSADRAIMAVHQRHVAAGCPYCTAHPKGVAPGKSLPEAGN